MHTASPKTVSQPGAIKLVAFDVDGTLVVHPRNEVIWSLFNARFGSDKETGWQRYLDYRAGKTTYAQWVALDVGGWQRFGATRAQMCAIIRDELRLIPGAHDTMATLRARGYRLAIISGTLDLVIEQLLPDIHFDEVFTNTISFDAQGLVSTWQATPYDGDGKATALAQIAQREKLALSQCAFVGDHINDIAVLRVAGFGIAFCPKHERVRTAADLVVDSDDLRVLLTHFPPRA